MVGVSAGMHDPVKCIGVGEESSQSQWLAITGDRKGGRAWGDTGAGGPDTAAEPPTGAQHTAGISFVCNRKNSGLLLQCSGCLESTF